MEKEKKEKVHPNILKGGFWKIFLLLALLLLAGCTGKNDGNLSPSPPVPAPSGPLSPTPGEPVVPPIQKTLDKSERITGLLQTTEAFPGISFSQPLEIQAHPTQTGKFLVVEKGGKIILLEGLPSGGFSQADFANLTSKVDSRSSEKGLLGLAFHPAFSDNGLLYLNYTDTQGTVIAEFQTSADRLTLQPETERVLLRFSQPFSNHNAGHMAFGPDDGYLYIATGDGGGAGDPQNNSQNRENIHGNLLRIDVNTTSPGRPYGIPRNNPYAGNTQGFLEEIYAYGLRNPWKFSFDHLRGLLWAADVGQDKREEINLIKAGGNYGWNIMEGTLCYPETRNCNREGLEMPVFEYAHPIGKSITGGHVYYGDRHRNLYGAYLYGDFISGKIWALWLEEDGTTDNRLIGETPFRISAFGIIDQEIYVVDYRGKVYNMAP